MDVLRRLTLVAAVALVGGCIDSVGIAGHTFACETDDDCLGESACVAGVCSPGGADATDGLPDVTPDVAPVEDTAPEVDAGPEDTAEEDVPPDVPLGPCDPVAQTGCGGDGWNCTYLGDFDAPQCVAAGEGGIGEPCGQDDPCARGLCAALNVGGDWLCYQFCDEDEQCAGGSCDDLDLPFRLCDIAASYTPCTLLTGDPCEAGEACYLILGGEEPVCLPSGTATVGQGCDHANDCNIGLACHAGLCAQLCELADDQCPDGLQCESYYGEAGVCDDDP